MKFLDFFAGIGGFRTGLEKAGHECLGFCEIDKYARQSYKAMHDTEGETEWHDITAVSDNDFRLFRGRVDIIAGGFPCQAFSVAGKRAGFNDTRGTLFFEIARAAKEIEPSYLFLENVKGLFSHDGGETFRVILQTLDELGYIVEWGLFNSKYWGVPQNRERVFILATKKEVFVKPKLFDLVRQQTTVTTRLRDILETNVDEKYYLSEEKTAKLISQLDSKYHEKLYKENSMITDNGPKHQYNVQETVTPPIRAQGGGSKPGVWVIQEAQSGTRLREESGTLRTGGVDHQHLLEPQIIETAKVKFDLNHYGNDQMNRVYDVDGQAPTIIAVSGGGREAKIAEPQLDMIGHLDVSGNDICKRVYSADGISPTVPTGTSGNTTPKIAEPQIIQTGRGNNKGGLHQIAPTVTSNSYQENNHLAEPQNDLKFIGGIEDSSKWLEDGKNLSRNFKQGNRVYSDEGIATTLTSQPVGGLGGATSLYATEEVRPVLTPDREEKRQQGRRFKDDDEPAFTINTIDRHGVAIGTPPKYRIRKLTPLECFRLQGFTDKQFKKAEAVNSNSQLYKQAGNSVTVNVIEAIAKQIGGTHT